MTTTDLVKMGEQFSGLPIDSLIGAPLTAATKANADMAITQTKFLLETCFKPAEDNKPREPIMIKLNITRPVIYSDSTEPKSVTTSIELPVLTILPINSLAIKNVDIHFEMEVKSAFSEDQKQSEASSTSAEGSFSSKVGWGVFSASVSGSVKSSSKSTSESSAHYEKSNSAKYSISVNAGQLQLPEGVTTIIQAYTQAIQPVVINTANSKISEEK